MLIASYPAYADPLRCNALPASPGQHSVQCSTFSAHAPSRPTPSVLPITAPQKPHEGPTTAPARERLLAVQLSHLASQHHTSDYNKLKFGSQGSPVSYAPLSIQLPAQVKSLKARQAINSGAKAWWLCSRGHNDNVVNSAQLQSIRELGTKPEEGMSELQEDAVAVQTLAQRSIISKYPNIEEEISAAMSSEIPTPSSSSSIHITKTSQSHPINVSVIIPLEHLPIIASQMAVATPPAPTMFYLPRICHLDRVLVVQSRGTFGHRLESATSLTEMRNTHRTVNPFRTPPPLIIWGESVEAGGELLRNALNVDLSSVTIESDTQAHSAHTFQGNFSPADLSLRLQSPQRSAVIPFSSREGSLSKSHPESYDDAPCDAANQLTSFMMNFLRQGRAMSAPPTMNASKMHLHLREKESNESQTEDSCSAACEPIVEDASNPLSVIGSTTVTPVQTPPNSSEHAADAPNPETRVDVNMIQPHAVLHPGCALAHRDCIQGDLSVSAKLNLAALPPQVHCQNRYPSFSEQLPSYNDLKLGNLYLSSCPGKKVRLTGPVKGRGAIFRDLRTDLQRVKSLGVACIVCCLDDSELEHLGVSWSEYSSIAEELELDVLRIPTPEGLAPLTPSALDVHLGLLISKYTLHGAPILAHCRGGVGRAGVIACCWLLKLGLCGWKDPDLCARTHGIGWNTPASASQAENSSLSTPSASPPRVCRATIRLVERVIAVVRQRRSLKAVETYEQVRFLAEFVEHLESRARVSRDVIDTDDIPRAPILPSGRECENAP